MVTILNSAVLSHNLGAKFGVSAWLPNLGSECIGATLGILGWLWCLEKQERVSFESQLKLLRHQELAREAESTGIVLFV